MIFIWIILLLIFILFIIPVQVEVKYKHTESSRYIVIISLLYGLVKKTIESDRKERQKKKSKDYKIDGLDLVQYLIDKGKIKDLSLKVNIGINDPTILGVTVGVIWAFINMGFAYFFKDQDIDDINYIDIQVIPKFEVDIFEIYFSCIIRLNLVYIIIVYLRNLNKKEGGDSIARTSNRRLNANYNE